MDEEQKPDMRCRNRLINADLPHPDRCYKCGRMDPCPDGVEAKPLKGGSIPDSGDV